MSTLSAGSEREFCGVCHIVLVEEYYKCPECQTLVCKECWLDKAKRCTECAERRPESADRQSTSESKRRRNPAFMEPLVVSPALAAVVGPGPLARTEVTKRMWDYIKANGLQDKKNRTMINADHLLIAVFEGRLQVSMFDMTRLVAGHLTRNRA